MSDDQGHQASTAGINPLDGEVVLQNAHQSWINWLRRLFFAAFLLLVGLAVGGSPGGFLMVLALMLFLSVYFSRRASRYIVTNQRVKQKSGLLGTSTNEARLETLNGISTQAGFIESLFGKGTVSVTDSAREQFTIDGVGNYEEVARTLREQQQAANQPGQGRYQQPAGGQQAPRGGQQAPAGGQQEQTGQHQPQQQGRQTQDTTDSSSSSDSRSEQQEQQDESTTSTAAKRDRCLDCGELVDADVDFCPECGTEDPFTVSPSEDSGTTASDGTNATAAEGMQATQTAEPETADRPVTAVAESVLTNRRPRSGPANELCRALADDDPDRERIETALADAVEAIERSAAVTDAVDRITDPTDRTRVDSSQRSIANKEGELATAIAPVLDGTVGLIEDLEECESRYERLSGAIGELCDAIEREHDGRLGATDAPERATQAIEVIETAETSTEPETSSTLSSVVDDVERSARPRTEQSRELLDALDERDDGDLTDVLRSTVESIDEYDELQAAVAEISRRDVRRRLTSLDDELQREEGAVYRHLADRIRELETMVERDDVDGVQLYAIYQECTFYDRTLLPRLSREETSGKSVDVRGLLDDVESRRSRIENEYVTVRADHNHTIPNHFLSLAGDLCDEAKSAGDDRPERAAGILSASNELLEHVEQLYERNEYSVMLRRLRG